jgi:3-deoxy-7-phosphoheptulonate synthase
MPIDEEPKMLAQLENRNVAGFCSLTAPARVKQRLPANDSVAQLVVETRRQVRDVLRGVDSRRLVVIVGPCSIHDCSAACEYASRLRAVADRNRDSVLVLMRTYFEKPRTSVGWKGLVNDPYLDGSCDMEAGLQTAREILLKVNRCGVPCASELLDPFAPQYLGDLLGWASIGARTTESQTHREMASGLSMPVGFKNGTDGCLDAAVNALISAGQPHSFLGIDGDGQAAVVKTTGNPDRHVVLRGGARPNYYREDVERAAQMVTAADPNLIRPIMVDSSHGNSGKDYRRQAVVCKDVVGQFVSGQRAVMGLLIESNLLPGSQTWRADAELQYGVSITDGCIGWEETEQLLDNLASQVRTAPRAA